MQWATVARVAAACFVVAACTPEAQSPHAAGPQPPVASPAPAAPKLRREIRVRVACDEEFRRRADWERIARRRVEKASAVYEQAFGIRWNVIDVVGWTSDDETQWLGGLLDSLAEKVDRAGVDVTVGVCGQTRGKGADREYEMVGHTILFGPVTLVRSYDESCPEDEMVATLAHEFGHVLGMWHSSDPESVMHADSTPTTPLRFDPQSAAVVEVTKDLDFAQGADWLDAARRGRIDEIYRSGHAPGESLPYVSRWLDDAIDAENAEALGDAVRLYGKALAAQAACTSDDDASLVACLDGLASSEYALDHPDVASLHARRAAAIVKATGVPSDPVLEPERILAEIAWDEGRRTAAIESMERVVSARLRALGGTDPDTKDVKETLDAWRAETSPSSKPVEASPAVPLVIRVRIAADEEFQRQSDWERRARSLIDQASEIFERRFGIAWKAVGVATWKSDDDARMLLDLANGLQRGVPTGGADVVVGFTGQTRARGASQIYEKLGYASLLGSTAIVMTTGDEDAARVRRTLVHELAHLLGAWHSKSKSSVMYVGGDRSTDFEFDPQNAAMIEMARDAGLPRGIGWIDEPRRARMREMYRADHEPSEVLPTVAVACWEGESALFQGRLPDARRHLTRALAEQEDCVGPNDESLVKCLMALSRTCRAEGPASEAEAARLERRAADIVVASNRAHRQNRPAEEPGSSPSSPR